MGALLCISGLMLDVVGSISFVMSLYVFWEEAIQKNRRWAFALVGPPLGVVVGWGGAVLLVVGTARLLPADWETLLLFVGLLSQVLALCGWLFLLTSPVVWLYCAIRCWPVVHQAVWGGILSLCVVGGGILGMYVATEWLRV